MIELSPAQMRIAKAIRGGASTIEEICAATGGGDRRVKRTLGTIGDALGIARIGKLRRDCDRTRVVAAVRVAEGLQVKRRAPYGKRSAPAGIIPFWRDSMPRPAPSEWPAYYGGAHDLGDRL